MLLVILVMPIVSIGGGGVGNACTPTNGLCQAAVNIKQSVNPSNLILTSAQIVDSFGFGGSITSKYQHSVNIFANLLVAANVTGAYTLQLRQCQNSGCTPPNGGSVSGSSDCYIMAVYIPLTNTATQFTVSIRTPYPGTLCSTVLTLGATYEWYWALSSAPLNSQIQLDGSVVILVTTFLIEEF